MSAPGKRNSDTASEFRPRFAICNETFRKWPFDRAFAFAAECGYRGIEIAPFTISNLVTAIPSKRRREIRRLAEKNGMEVVGLHWLLARTKGFHLTSPDSEIRQNTAAYLGELARFCSGLGGKLLVFGSPKQRSLIKAVTPEKGIQYATEVIQAALPALEKADVTIAMEPLSPKITNFLSTAAETAALIKRVGSKRCRPSLASLPPAYLFCVKLRLESGEGKRRRYCNMTVRQRG